MNGQDCCKPLQHYWAVGETKKLTSYAVYKNMVANTVYDALLLLEFTGLERHNIRQLRGETIAISLNPQS